MIRVLGAVGAAVIVDGAGADEVLDSAMKIYLDIEKIEWLSRDPILTYRIANVLTMRGDSELAVDEYEDACLALENADHLPEKHYMRVRIPRQFGVALWGVADRIKKRGRKLSNPGFLLGRRRNYYLRAYEVTASVHGRDVEPGILDVWTQTDGITEEEKKSTGNNLIEYAVCYLEAGGEKEKLEEYGYSTALMGDIMGDILVDGIGGIDRPAIADTIRAAERYLFGDKDMEKEAANRVKALLTSNPEEWRIHYGEDMIAEMLEDAEVSLAEIN